MIPPLVHPRPGAASSRAARRRSKLISSIALVLGLVAVTPVHADPGSDPDLKLQKSRPARFIMGVKFGGGGTLWDEPDDVPKRSDGQSLLPIFEETRGGYTMSAGYFLQGIFFDHLGLEVGFHFVKHTLLETIDWTFTEVSSTNVTTRVAESDTELAFTALHVPILVKAVIPAGTTRVSLGIGPEFAFGSWAKTKFDITKTDEPRGPDGEMLLPGNRKVFKTVRPKLEDSVYLTVNFGVEIVAGDFIIPVDIHWSYNFSQQKKYLQRAAISRRGGDGELEPLPANPPDTWEPTEVTLETRDTMYGGIRIGIAYQF